MNDGLPPIKGFLPTTLIEWEGRISCALFLPGCDLRCPFCHAGDLLGLGPPLETIPFGQVLDHLGRSEGWIDGVVVSGGEPTLQSSLPDLLRALRQHVPHIKLDTNGTHPEVVGELIGSGLVDCVAMDVKAPLGEAYAEAAGVPVDLGAIEASIDLLREGRVGHEFRTTVVPGLHSREAIVEIGRLLGPGESLVLQQFAPLNCLDPAYNDLRPYTRDALREMAAAAGACLGACRVRGDATSCEATP